MTRRTQCQVRVTSCELEKFTEYGADRCQSLVKDKSRQCGRAALRGYEYCKLHGGKTVKQKSKEMVKRDKNALMNGRYTESMPKELVATYSRSLADPDLLNLSNEIALIDSRTAELVETLQTHPAPDFPALIKSIDRIKRRYGDDPGLVDELNRLREIMTGAYARDSAWEKIRESIKTRAVLADAERKRRSDMQGYLTAKQAMFLAGQLVDIASRHIKSTDDRRAFAKDIKNVTGGSYVTSGDPDPQMMEVIYEEKAKDHVERRREELAGRRESGS